MAPYARWVLPSFKQTLVDACDEYLKANDHSNDKPRSQLIARVSKDITDIAEANNEKLPDDLEKVCIIYSACCKCVDMFLVCPHMVWELCIRIGKGAQAR
jgi:hypothetical protein